ncbi:MAG: hypothetical protein EOP38_27005 [Rubrivivax sp.]|nr:MAG: hypothetical protein EOP38_27005 [Rubrivivax sp.]
MGTHNAFTALSSIFGEAEAAKFLLVLHRQSAEKRRLYFWQEQMLSRYCIETGAQVRTLDEALSAFNFCPVHGVALMRDEVSIQYGTRKPPSEEEVKHSNENYPYANLKSYGPCWVEDRTRKQVMYCSGCRVAYFNEQQERQGDQSAA